MPYDRHEVISGVSGANPVLVPRNFATNANNRWFRNDINQNRPPFHSIELSFETDEERIWFAGGNFQGATFYNSWPSFLKPYLICSIAGRIFKIEIQGRTGHVTTLFQGNDPVLQHAWFQQGLDWLVIQDGVSAPIVWNASTAARRAGENEVPTGSVMAFIHGRLVVTSSDGKNLLAVGDLVYSEDQVTTGDIIRFTEIQFAAEGGIVGLPVFIGDITGAYAMPYLDTGTAQNELVILGTEGAVSIDLSRPRNQWLDSQLLRISLIGGGCVSSHSTCALNGDLFFRSAEGIRSYRNSRSEFNQSWKQSPISSDVRRWLDYDAPDLLQFNSQVSWNNLLLSTVSPAIEGPNNIYAGWHRYHRGFVVMDANPESNTVRAGAPIWQGVWTGIRPTQFVTGRMGNDEHCFAFSYDRDGKNRLYEIVPQGFDTFEGKRRKMFSMYDTSTFGTIERTTSLFEPKTIQGGEMGVSTIEEQVTMELAVRPDSSPCFVKHHEVTFGCECQERPCFTGTLPSQARIYFGGLDGKCDPSTNLPLNKAHYWQSRVKFTGEARVEVLAYRFDVEKNPTACRVDGATCNPITCCEDTYAYHLADPGDNDEQPNIPIPSDTPTIYQSTQTYTASCPPSSSGSSVTATQSATSEISQADADAKALQAAINLAQSQLQCTLCEGLVLATFTVNDSSIDLTPFFEEEYGALNGRPWRMIDQHTLDIYAQGLVIGSTLSITFAQETGDVTFDPTTFILTDVTGTTVPVALQVGCPGGSWPSIEDYNPIT